MARAERTGPRAAGLLRERAERGDTNTVSMRPAGRQQLWQCLFLMTALSRQAYRRTSESCAGDYSAQLITEMMHAAVDVQVHARIVKGTSEDRHRGGTCPAAVHGSSVIAALTGSDTADDQPDDNNHRSDVNLDLLSVACVKYGGTANRDCRPFPWSGVSDEAYLWAAIPSAVRANPAPFPENWKLGRRRRSARWAGCAIETSTMTMPPDRLGGAVAIGC